MAKFVPMAHDRFLMFYRNSHIVEKWGQIRFVSVLINLSKCYRMVSAYVEKIVISCNRKSANIFQDVPKYAHTSNLFNNYPRVWTVVHFIDDTTSKNGYQCLQNTRQGFFFLNTKQICLCTTYTWESKINKIKPKITRIKVLILFNWQIWFTHCKCLSVHQM